MSSRMVGVIGFSGAGKTTLIEQLTRAYVASGVTVSAIKHTHHDVISAGSVGDTQRFLDAGATDAILANNGRFKHWQGKSSLEGNYRELQTLFDRCIGNQILIEGLKFKHSWPVIIKASTTAELRELWSPYAVAICASSPIGTPFKAIPQVHCDDIAGLLKILGETAV